MATRCSRMLSSVSSGSQLPLSLNAFSPARTSRQTMLRFAPDILVTAASNTLEAARQMSGPVPSPSMNGMMGWSGTIQWPSRKSILAPTAPPRRPSTWVGMAPILQQKGPPLQASLFAALRPTLPTDRETGAQDKVILELAAGAEIAAVEIVLALEAQTHRRPERDANTKACDTTPIRRALTFLRDVVTAPDERRATAEKDAHPRLRGGQAQHHLRATQEDLRVAIPVDGGV